jgi:predicted DNA binding protein
MTETPAVDSIPAPTITVAAYRIAERVGDLTPDQLKAAVAAALVVLDDEAAEEVGAGGYFDGPAMATLNAMAEAVGLSRIGQADFEDEEDFFL